MIEQLLAKTGAKIDSQRPIDYGVQYKLSRGADVAIVNIYTGKRGTRVVVQLDSPLAKELRDLTGTAAAEKRFATSEWSIWCGSDEAGKGEWLGPLAVAAVALTKKSAALLAKLNVQDSKALTDASVRYLDARIRDEADFKLIGWLPEEYNQRYEKAGNINRLLGIAHAEAIAGVLEKQPKAQAAVVDQFGDENYVKHALLAKGIAIHLVQRPKADATDLAVAAASIVARAAFLRGLRKLETDYGVALVRGINEETLPAARAFIARHGRDQLGRIAKLHFKTTAQV